MHTLMVLWGSKLLFWDVLEHVQTIVSSNNNEAHDQDKTHFRTRTCIGVSTCVLESMLKSVSILSTRFNVHVSTCTHTHINTYARAQGDLILIQITAITWH